jgi:chromosome segregation ATPase
MARRGHTSDGKIFCSGCGSTTESDMPKCEHCSEVLDDDFKAMICPYCTTVVGADSNNCTNCGLKFTSEKDNRSKEDELFLSRLLEWGKNLEAKRVQEDKMETQKATDIFKDVVGAIAPTPFQEETLKQIQISAEERDEFEKREDSILKMAEPLKKALDLRKQSLDGLEMKFRSLQDELRNLSEEDLDSDRKRSDIERQLAEITVERSSIQRIEENINNMDSAYRQLLKQHSAEIKEKEEALNTRLKAFKGEMERREKEKERLKTRDEFLENKEKELVARIDSLRERESSLKKTEDKMKEQIASLQAEKHGVDELKGPAAGLIVARGKWVVDEEELAGVLKKSKKVREDWLEEQKKIQDSISKGETVEQAAGESTERLDKREQELQMRIGELEKQLAKTISEEKSIQKEETDIISDINKLKKVLKVLDDLLENLPDDIVQRFAKSRDYREYEELMEELGL